MPLFAGLLTVIFGSIVKAFLFLVGFLIVRALLLLGFSYVTYQGFDYFARDILAKVVNQIMKLPDFITTMLALAQFDVALSIIFSAYVLKFSIKTASKMTFFN